LLEDWEKSATIAFQTSSEGWAHGIWLIGSSSKGGRHLGQSLWLREVHGRSDGSPPPVDLGSERKTGEFVQHLVADGLVSAIHDISDGGLLITLAEMALAGNVGAEIDIEDQDEISLAARMFAEDQGLYVVTSWDNGDQRIPELAAKFGISCTWIGMTGGNKLSIGDLGSIGSIPLSDLRAAHEGFFPALMQGEL
jgi:phosphoribosylformylglycinamidine synthase